MLKALEKAFYTIVTILAIILVIPGFVTVVGFAVCIVGHFGFDMTPHTQEVICNFVTSVWQFYGIFK